MSLNMMTASNGNIFRVTGRRAENAPVTGEFLQKGQWRGALMLFYVFIFLSAPEQMIV